MTSRKEDVSTVCLYVAMELSLETWKLAFSTCRGRKARRRNVLARDLKGLQRELTLAKKRLGLAADARVICCYEAGRDGFYLHRYLQMQGIINLVVDSASIEVNRRARQAKTDKLDVGKLLGLLIR